MSNEYGDEKFYADLEVAAKGNEALKRILTNLWLRSNTQAYDRWDVNTYFQEHQGGTAVYDEAMAKVWSGDQEFDYVLEGNCLFYLAPNNLTPTKNKDDLAKTVVQCLQSWSVSSLTAPFFPLSGKHPLAGQVNVCLEADTHEAQDIRMLHTEKGALAQKAMNEKEEYDLVVQTDIFKVAVPLSYLDMDGTELQTAMQTIAIEFNKCIPSLNVYVFIAGPDDASESNEIFERDSLIIKKCIEAANASHKTECNIIKDCKNISQTLHREQNGDIGLVIRLQEPTANDVSSCFKQIKAMIRVNKLIVLYGGHGDEDDGSWLLAEDTLFSPDHFKEAFACNPPNGVLLSNSCGSNHWWIHMNNLYFYSLGSATDENPSLHIGGVLFKDKDIAKDTVQTCLRDLLGLNFEDLLEETMKTQAKIETSVRVRGSAMKDNAVAQDKALLYDAEPAMFAFPAGSGSCSMLRTKTSAMMFDGGVKREFDKYAGSHLVSQVPNVHIVVSHMDRDHTYGIQSLLQFKANNVDKCPKIETLRINVPNNIGNDPRTRSIKDAGAIVRSAKKGVVQTLETKTVKGQITFEADGVKVVTIHPTDQQYEDLLSAIGQKLANKKKFNPNLSSIVSLITYHVDGYTSYSLITGDAHAEDILAGLKAHNPQIPTFKYVEVPHHGAATNYSSEAECTTFFTEIVAEYYVLSSNGRYNHPDESVVRTICECHKKRHESDNTVKTRLLFTYPSQSQRIASWVWFDAKKFPGLEFTYIKEEDKFWKCQL